VINILSMQRHGHWLAQAERDLTQARQSAASGLHEWACFAAQQSAEKSAKALYQYLHEEGWGHVVAKLLTDCPVKVPSDLIEKARVLDNYYIPTRDADSHADGAPFEHIRCKNGMI
jgi:HEPN domain-containing protein